MNNTTRSILLAGVGGQGIIRASDILSLVMIEAGYDVKKSEVHGMAQRGGCVTSHVRYGKKVYSPMAKKGDVDILVSFEKLETLRYLDYLKPDGKIIINDEEIYPPSVNLGEVEYPDNINELIASHFSNPKVIRASEMALKAGNHKTSNSAILGALSLYLDIQTNFWESVLRNAFSEKILEANLRAFNFGRNA
ncbi:MAG: indolepyruvate oxidoreductase subunit beta [Desulfobacteraceae bacterium 4484_190.3]|nr:MAG: indolepyruvate oxidoreductase subunit beta [Desulfobacteraceae bacterium 4484_190.3]